ncbi:MAG TPA: lytic murein transglycosylase, partial [Xanthobacteraceae bacterium]|nr:lytic murein transglycosylase [Xanthobacteraceae bacterium]
MHASRRDMLQAAAATAVAAASLAVPLPAHARPSFEEWVEDFRARARARGISDATYRRVMNGLRPDTSVYALDSAQPEFTEELWQYLNRRVSDWRIRTGREVARAHARLLGRIERDYGVDRRHMLGLWGMESAFGEVIDNPKIMRPIFPALAALAWGEPRRRRYWEKELLNALAIVERGWAQPEQMVGSWAGAMGHTQWMPEVWLNMGVDYDHDGRIFPFDRPDDALAGTARYLVTRGKYRRGQAWGLEVRLPADFNSRLADRRTWRAIAAWQKLGIAPASGGAFPPLGGRARLWLPVAGGPAFLLGQNFFAIRSYNPSYNYTLAIAYLGDRIGGAGPFVQAFPGGERALTLEEIQEVQRRLSALGYDTGGTDGRVGRDTMRAVQAFQRKTGLSRQ